jgi:hypothetical protein
MVEIIIDVMKGLFIYLFIYLFIEPLISKGYEREKDKWERWSLEKMVVDIEASYLSFGPMHMCKHMFLIL